MNLLLIPFFCALSSYKIVVLTSNRLNTLKKNLKNINSVFGHLDYEIHIFVDIPLQGSNIKTINFVKDVSLQNDQTNMFIYSRHMGSRTVWLSVLSMKPPFLLLEEDVFITENTEKWYDFCLKNMETHRQLLGCSFSTQPTVAVIGSPYKINYNSSYTYPLIGSHGFMISPYHFSNFINYLQTRKEHLLQIPGLITTKWYNNFKKKKIEKERMPEIELVSYSYHNNLTVLYPPTNNPFSIHCAMLHGKDMLKPKCLKRLKNTYFPKAIKFPRLDWDAKCISDCKLV